MRFGYWQAFWFGSMTLLAGEASAQTNGIFADFNTTLGSFTCQLDYSNSPMAVANFIGLATGERPWLDLATGKVRTDPFYDGLTFHRVVTNFVIQGGSPSALGGDGPGYAFQDHFTSALNFNSPWVLGMANSGPDSNGSQFFVTVVPYTVGNNSYVILGRVVSGTNVVTAIDHVPTDDNDKPLTNVVMQQVVIRRVGAAAQAFDINAQGLALVTELPAQISQSAGAVSIAFSNRVYADNRLFSGTNLSSWTAGKLGIEIEAPSSHSASITNALPAEFFRLSQVQYPSNTLAPKNILSRQMVLRLTTGGSGPIYLTLNDTGGGTFGFLPGVVGGNISSYSWDQEPFRGYLILALPSHPVLGVYCRFTSGTNGTFSGTAYPLYPTPFGAYDVGGSFTLAGP